jgi:hypothetical protein
MRAAQRALCPLAMLLERAPSSGGVLSRRPSKHSAQPQAAKDRSLAARLAAAQRAGISILSAPQRSLVRLSEDDTGTLPPPRRLCDWPAHATKGSAALVAGKSVDRARSAKLASKRDSRGLTACNLLSKPLLRGTPTYSHISWSAPSARCDLTAVPRRSAALRLRPWQPLLRRALGLP